MLKRYLTSMASVTKLGKKLKVKQVLLLCTTHSGITEIRLLYLTIAIVFSKTQMLSTFLKVLWIQMTSVKSPGQLKPKEWFTHWIWMTTKKFYSVVKNGLTNITVKKQFQTTSFLKVK